MKKISRKKQNNEKGREGSRQTVMKRNKKYVEPEVDETVEAVEAMEPVKAVDDGEKAEDGDEEEAETTAPEETRQPYDGNTAFHLYLREVGQSKLLTPKEEIALAKRIQKGDAKAREEMIKSNLRLVVKIARDYEDYGLPMLDLINEGNMGLMKAVERFDPRKGAKLSTYASWWIKQSIRRALANQSKTIRLPVHVVDKVAHLRRAEVKLRETLDRDPTDEELAHELQIKPRQVELYRRASRAPVSLDAPI